MKNRKQLMFVLTTLAVILAMVVFLPSLISAGDLEPPGSPSPTMKTLGEVESRIPISSLPISITESGSYYLTGNMSASDDGIKVHADNVTIDLMGYAIDGSFFYFANCFMWI